MNWDLHLLPGLLLMVLSLACGFVASERHKKNGNDSTKKNLGYLFYGLMAASLFTTCAATNKEGEIQSLKYELEITKKCGNNKQCIEREYDSLKDLNEFNQLAE